MSTAHTSSPYVSPPDCMPAPSRRIPPLVAGDRLTRDEFERRYAAMPNLKKAELIEGIVYMPSPVSVDHGSPHARMMMWLGVYEALTPGVMAFDNTTVRLGSTSEPQPDGMLRIVDSVGGQSQVSADRYIEGAPELSVEVAATSANYDLHGKLNVYRQHGVREYVAWRVEDQDLDWFVLRSGEYQPLVIDESGIARSEVFPGLWLDKPALLRGDMAQVLAVLQQGLATPEHTEFVERLQNTGRK
jgi:Uma2 family endonuclease